MYNIIKFTDNSGSVEHVATAKSINYFRAETNPELIAIEIKDIKDAIELASYFDRKIDNMWDKLMTPPIFYKDPIVNTNIKLEDLI